MHQLAADDTWETHWPRRRAKLGLSAAVLIAALVFLSTADNTGSSTSENELSTATVAHTIDSGVWRQDTAAGQHGTRTLSIESAGKGQMTIELDGFPAMLVGANNVDIETTWSIEGDTATFVLESGSPAHAFSRILALSLDKVTPFTIEKCTSTILILRRQSDSKEFRWRRLDSDVGSMRDLTHK